MYLWVLFSVMSISGYVRMRTKDQDFQLQVEALENSGCERVFKEKQSGTTTKGRDELANCENYMRAGDTLIVTKVDRLARSLRDFQNLVHELEGRGIAIK